MNPHRVSPKTPRINDDRVDLTLQSIEDLIKEARDERSGWPECWTVLIFSQDLSSAFCNNSKGVPWPTFNVQLYECTICFRRLRGVC